MSKALSGAADPVGLPAGESTEPVSAAPTLTPEPVAHICILPTKDAGPTKFFTAPSDPRGFPVYAHLPSQPPREPLSDEQIIDIWAGCSDNDDTINIITLARAVLAAQEKP